MPTETVYNYRLYCDDEGGWFTTWRSESDGAPTQCPNCLTVNIRDIAIIETVNSNDVHIAGVGEDVLLPEQSKSFPDRTGYNVYVPGHRFVALKGQVNNFDVTYSVDYKLQGMGFKVDDKVVDGDKIDIQIVDVDGIVYPAGTVLVTFANDLFLWPNREFICICEDVKTLYSWCYLRMVYDSVGATDDVVVYWQHHLRTIPA